MQGTLTGDFESCGGVAFGKPNDALGGTQSIQDAVVKQTLDEAQTGRADGLGLFEAPLGVTHFESDVFRGQVLIEGMTLSWAGQAGMYGFEFVLVIDTNGGLADAYIEGFTDQTPGG